MKLPCIILLIILSLSGCFNQGNQGNTSGSTKDLRSDKEIEDIISKNKSKQLFLSFWKGMDNDELKMIKGYETKKGNLRDSSFIISIKMPKGYTLNDDNIKDYQFGVNSWGSSILLVHHDSYYKKIESKNTNYSTYSLKRKREFDYVEKYLIQLYDSKYERIIDTTDSDIYVWRKISPEHFTIIISLVPYFGFIEKRNGKESVLGKLTWDLWNGSLEYSEISYKSKLDNFQLGLSRFLIYYQTKEDYFFQRDFRANKSKRELLEKNKEQTEKEMKIEKSNSNL